MAYAFVATKAFPLLLFQLGSGAPPAATRLEEEMFPIPVVGGAPTTNRLWEAVDDADRNAEQFHALTPALSPDAVTPASTEPPGSADSREETAAWLPNVGTEHNSEETNLPCRFPWIATRCLTEGMFPKPGKEFLAPNTVDLLINMLC